MSEFVAKAEKMAEAGNRLAKANETQFGGDHYKKMKIEHWDYVLANDIPYMEAQIIKYVSRWRDKGGMLDLHKARHFLDKLIEFEESQQTKLTKPEEAPTCAHEWSAILKHCDGAEYRCCMKCDLIMELS